jgi:hypothetical protein
MKLVSDRVTR